MSRIFAEAQSDPCNASNPAMMRDFFTAGETQHFHQSSCLIQLMRRRC
ncbi:formin-like protein 20-like protein [Corchorus olitorius]|uniref:Formin-like protein 20-like protein n=1 Tax=Corchorus olitorius TaxID=93759 RepID=A0A1R3JV60_9ROSI|nr:formin-like protein 20-like protein [Corchorus olitorius]